VIGLGGCMCSLILETAMVARYAGSSNHAGNAMGVFFTFCFISFYGGGCDTTSYVYCSKSPLPYATQKPPPKREI